MVDQEKLYRGFIYEANRILEDAESQALQWEREGLRDVIDALFRGIHTIKGGSGLFDVPCVTGLAHSVETLLSRLRNTTVESRHDYSDILLRSFDELRHLVHNPGSKNPEALIAELESAANQVRSEATESAEGSTEPNGKLNSSSNSNVDSREEQLKARAATRAGRSNQAIRIPRRLLNVARAADADLTVVWLDLVDQKNQSLTSIHSNLESLRRTGLVIDHGPLTGSAEEIRRLSYFLILFLKEDPETFLESVGLKARTIKSLTSGYFKNGEESGQGTGESTLPAVKQDQLDSDSASSNGKEAALQRKASPSAGEQSHLRVPATLIDRLINVAGETVVARNQLMQRISEVDHPALALSGKRLSQLITMLQEDVMRTRLQPLQIVFQRLPRLVRDQSRQNDKEVELKIKGGEVEVDKHLIDSLSEALMHMIRNSIDHGLEVPDQRVTLGKDRVGRIEISAELLAGSILIEVLDDGRGLDRNRILERAMARGLVAEDSHLTDEEIHHLIFAPGFSTAAELTTTSGRGVGMDIVLSTVHSIGGSIEIETEPQSYTRFRIRIPQTVSIVSCLLLRSSEYLYAFPQQNVEEIIKIESDKLITSDPHLLYNNRGQLLPSFDLARALDSGSSEQGEYLAVLASGKHRFGLIFDAVMDPEELLVKSLGRHFHNLSYLSGAAVVGSGDSVLVMDVGGMARMLEIQPADSSEQTIEKTVDSLDQKYLVVRFGGQLYGIPAEKMPRIERIKEDALQVSFERSRFTFNGNLVSVLAPSSALESTGGALHRSVDYAVLFQNESQTVAIAADEVVSVATGGVVLTDTFRAPCVYGHIMIGNESCIVVNLDALMMRERESANTSAGVGR